MRMLFTHINADVARDMDILLRIWIARENLKEERVNTAHPRPKFDQGRLLLTTLHGLEEDIVLGMKGLKQRGVSRWGVQEIQSEVEADKEGDGLRRARRWVNSRQWELSEI